MQRRNFATLGLAALFSKAALGSEVEGQDKEPILSIDIIGLAKNRIAVELHQAGEVPMKFTIETSDEGTLTIDWWTDESNKGSRSHTKVTNKHFGYNTSDKVIVAGGKDQPGNDRVDAGPSQKK